MFLQDKDSKFKEQGKVKPKIEDIVSTYFNGETKEIVLDFIAYLLSNKMTPQWASVNSWKISFKSKGVAYIKLWNGSWYIDPDVDFGDSAFEIYATNEKLEKNIVANIEKCINCLPNGKCTPGRSVKIFGKDFTNVCHAPRFQNPNVKELDCIKKIFEYRKGLVAENKVPKVHYIGKSKQEEFKKKYGLSNFNKAFEVFGAYYNNNLSYASDKLFKIYTKIEKSNPKIHPLKLLETGLEEYTK
jgi:hypothetical protein